MEQKAIEALLDGQTVRAVARWLVPSVSHASVHRYLVTYLRPAMKNAETLKALLPERLRSTETTETAPETIAQQPLLPSNAQLVKQAIMAAPTLQIRDNRIRAKTDRWNRAAMIVNGRAKEMEGEVAGGESGFLARDYKGSGESLTPVYKFDDALFKSFGDIEKDIAIELGQWQENNAAGSVSVQIICPQAPSDAMPRVSFASEDTIEAGEDIGVIQSPG